MARFAEFERLPDGDLVAAIGRRDREAFEVFYRRHLPAVLAYLLRSTGDREAAADLSAEVFAAVLLASRRYRARTESALPWVIGIARNTLGASRRRGRVENRARLKLGFEPVPLEDDDLDRVESVAAIDARRLSELLAALPEHERDAIKARVMQERSYPEIARELRCSESVVRKRVSRGLARMRKELGSG